MECDPRSPIPERPPDASCVVGLGIVHPETRLEASGKPSVQGVPEPAYDGLALALRLALDRLTPALAAAARPFVATRAWLVFGHARVDDYARERLRRSGRWLRDLARLGEALDSLPRLAGALTGADGRRPVGQVAAQAIGGVATAESVDAWIELARSLPVRTFKEEIRKARAQGSSSPLDSAACSGPADSDAGEDTELESYLPVRFEVPSAVKLAFGEARRLHQAVVGNEASVVSFVEALVGESLAGTVVEELEEEEPPPRIDPAERETLLARCTDNWSELADRPEPCEREPLRLLVQFRRLMRDAGRGGPAELDGQLQRLVRLDERLRCELGRLLMLMGHERGWSALCFASLEHYAEQRLGLSRTAARDRVWLARVLLELPLVSQAYEAGRLGFEATRLVARALAPGPVDPCLERAWVEHASRITVKRLRDEARVIDARRRLDPLFRGQAPLGDADWYRSLRLEPGQIRARVRRLASGLTNERYAVEPLYLRLPAQLAALFCATVEAARRSVEAIVQHEAGGDSAVAERPRTFSTDTGGPRHADGDEEAVGVPQVVLAVARMFSTRRRRVPEWVGLLAMITDFVRTWDDPRAMPKRAADRIYHRDGWRCAAPTCTSRCNLESHHLDRLSQGGHPTSQENQLSLCRFHHQRGEHGVLASCRGRAPLGVVWRLGRRDVAWRYRNERRLDPPSDQRAREAADDVQDLPGRPTTTPA